MLLKLQKDFMQAILNNPQHVTDLVKGGDSAERLQIYRNNTYLSLSAFLASLFPTLQALVGEKFFKQMAYKFIEQHPPTSGNLDDYGHDMPVFIENFKPLASHPYMADVARLELARRFAYNAPFGNPLPANLTISSAQEVNLKLSPSAVLIKSNYPIASIWQMAQGHDVQPNMKKGEYVLVIRPNLDVAVVKLSKAEYICLQQVKAGENLNKAIQKSMHTDSGFDSQQLLSKCLSFKALTQHEGA
tara:strand:- start:127 stop:861 length:735 start_codon:yes stop_codon:yes gene_type:complete